MHRPAWLPAWFDEYRIDALKPIGFILSYLIVVRILVWCIEHSPFNK